MQTLQTESTTEKVQCIAFGLGTDLAFVHPLQEGAVDSQAADEMDCSTMDQQIRLNKADFDWAEFFLCPFAGCGHVRKHIDALQTHCESHYFAVLDTDWAAYCVPLSRPDLFNFGVVFPKPTNELRPFDWKQVQWPSTEGIVVHHVDSFRVGSFIARTSFFKHIQLQHELSSGDVSIRIQMSEMESYQILIPKLGLEDVELLCNHEKSPFVELLLKARVARFSGARGEDWAGVGRASYGAAIALRLEANEALSFLAGICGHYLALDYVKFEERGHTAVNWYAAVLRMLFVRRDLMARGWTVEDLAPELLWERLSSHDTLGGVTEETFRYNSSCTLARDAPQLAHHVPVPVQDDLSEREHAEAIKNLESLDTPRENVVELPRKRNRPPPLTPSQVDLIDRESRFDSASAGKGKVGHRPKTGYQLFHKHQVEELKRINPNIKHQLAFKKAGIMWTEMTVAEKEVWQEQAEVKPRGTSHHKKPRAHEAGPEMSVDPSGDSVSQSPPKLERKERE